MDIKEILQSLSIGTVLDHYGLKPNRNKMINCPFHDDKTLVRRSVSLRRFMIQGSCLKKQKTTSPSYFAELC